MYILNGIGIEFQMQYSLQYVSEESSTATLCAMMTVGVLGKDVSVILQTHDITGMDTHSL